MGGYAWVTLATNDAYSLGALVLAHSLRRVGTKHELAVLVTPGVTQTMREKLAAVFSLVREVNVLDSKDETNLALLARPELGITFTKLHCWRLTQYDKCVFLDADTLVVRNCDELFEREELSAAPDVGWPDCFNSGVFVFKPSQQTFASITAFAAAKGSFDGGDQGLLNMYFNDWAHKDISKHLPFIYNMCSTATYSYLPAFKQFGEDVRIIHFIGMTKPWLQYVDTVTGTVQPAPGTSHLQPLLQLWWNVFFDNVHRQLSPTMATSTLAPIWHEYIPLPFKSSISTPPLFSALDNETDSDVYLKTIDFSEFKDPWDDYRVEDDTLFKSECTNQDRTCFFAANNEFSFQIVHKEYHMPTQPHYKNYSEPSFINQDEDYGKKHRNEIHTTIPHFTEHQDTHEYIRPDNVNEPQEQIFFCAHQSSNEKYFVDQSTCTPRWDEQSANYSKQHNEQNFDQGHPKDHNAHNHCQNKSQHSLTYGHSEDSQSQLHNTEHNESIHSNDFQEHKWGNDNNEENIRNCNLHISHHKQENQQHYQEYRQHHQCNEVMSSDNSTNSCKQITESNIMLCEYREFNETSSSQDEGMDRQTNIQRLKSHPIPKPCTDLHNVATQSDLNMTERLDSSNAGLAGALAQMTLGEPRSAEQIAFEEHMRKQSWEQGQIDYMGRDSFDNIWRKICETLSFAPERLPSPPKETSPPTESIEEKTVLTTDFQLDNPTAEVISKQIGEELIFGTPVDEALVQKECTGGKSTTPSVPSLESALPEVASEEKDIVDAIINPLEKLKQISAVTDREQPAAEVIAEKDLTVSQVLELQHANVDSHLETSSLSASMKVTTEAPLSSLPREEFSQQTIVSAPSCEILSCPSKVLKDPSPPQLASAPTNILDIISKSPVTTERVESCAEVSNVVAPIDAETHQKTVLTQATSINVMTKQSEKPSTEGATVAPSISDLPETSKPIAETGMNIFVKSNTKIEANVGQHEQHANVLSAASEISTVSPVPIQVAESVLQAEPKESLLDDSKPLVTSVISSTVTPIHEATALPSEGLTRQDDKLQLNGSASIVVQGQSKEKLDNRDRGAITAKEDTGIEKFTDMRVSELSSIETPLPKPEIRSDSGITTTLSQKSDVESLEAACAEEDSGKYVELKEHVEETDVTPSKGTEIQKLDLSLSESSPLSLSEESPIRPARTKELNIPSTPVVTEATPPTSPPITMQQELESEAKASKKSMKKAAQKSMQESELPEDGDGTEKKPGKKAGKKVIKKVKSKSEESFEEAVDNSNAAGKAKKTAKVVKKTTKPAQMLGTDTSVPETPPPGSSDAPVPPKRKVKPTTGKTEEKSSKKSDAE